MSSKLAEDKHHIDTEDAKSTQKWKCKSKFGMTPFMSSTHKSRKGSDKIAG
jgi:hypothetical protein